MSKVEQIKFKNPLIYILLTLSLSWLFQFWIINRGGIKTVGLLGLILLMWLPGLIALSGNFLSRAFPIQFKLNKIRFKKLFPTLLIPFCLAFVTALVCHMLSIREFLPLSTSIFQMIIILFIGFFGAMGEEIGWRGYLLPALLEKNVSHTYLIVGCVWGLWHLPLVIFGGYYKTDSIYFMGVTYFVSILSLSFFISYFSSRLKSLWPAVIIHSSHNFFFQTFFPQIFFTHEGTNGKWWEIIGADCGWLIAILYTIVSYFYFKHSTLAKI
jgi:uncharacterized protein